MRTRLLANTRAYLAGKGISPARSTLTLALDPEPVKCAWLWAIVLLVVGAGLGVGIRQLADKGAALQDLYGQLDIVLGTIRGVSPIPIPFSNRLIAARKYLAQSNVEPAKNNLEALDKQATSVVLLAGTLREMAEEIDGHARDVATIPDLDGTQRSMLRRATAQEREFLTELLQEDDVTTDEAKTKREERAQDIDSFGAFLDDYRSATSQVRGKLASALRAFAEKEFAKGREEWKKAIEEAGGAPSTATAGLAQRAVVEPAGPAIPTDAGDRPPWRIRHARLLLQLATVLGLLVLGLITVFEPDETFRSDGFADGVALFAWGLGSALAGTQAIDLAGKLAPQK
jgi:hypothetical protein